MPLELSEYHYYKLDLGVYKPINRFMSLIKLQKPMVLIPVKCIIDYVYSLQIWDACYVDAWAYEFNQLCSYIQSHHCVRCVQCYLGCTTHLNIEFSKCMGKHSWKYNDYIK